MGFHRCFAAALLTAAVGAGGLALGAGFQPAAAAERSGASGLPYAVTTVEQMAPEMGRAYVRGIQRALTAHRYDPGPADGILGPMTRLAIRDYQRDARLPVDGVASKELLDHLKFAQPKVYAKPKPEPDVTVLEIQTRLKVRGYYRGNMDGLVGGETREAIRAYRQDAGLAVNGAIDWPLIENLRLAPVREAGMPSGTTAGKSDEANETDDADESDETEDHAGLLDVADPFPEPPFEPGGQAWREPSPAD